MVSNKQWYLHMRLFTKYSQKMVTLPFWDLLGYGNTRQIPSLFVYEWMTLELNTLIKRSRPSLKRIRRSLHGKRLYWWEYFRLQTKMEVWRRSCWHKHAWLYWTPSFEIKLSSINITTIFTSWIHQYKMDKQRWLPICTTRRYFR